MPAVEYRPAHAAPPLARLLGAYDRAVAACASEDHAASRRSLHLLRAALELDTPAARGFDALYAWCEDAVDEGDFEAAARCLVALGEAWQRAVRSDRTPDDRPLRLA